MLRNKLRSDIAPLGTPKLADVTTDNVMWLG